MQVPHLSLPLKAYEKQELLLLLLLLPALLPSTLALLVPLCGRLQGRRC